jgi:O-antigen biosynthesis alpha-1,2-mannosyltransferase
LIETMRIVIDLQGTQTKSRYRGIGRYTLSFAKALIRNGSNHEFIVVLNGLFPHTISVIRKELEGILQESRIVVWTAPGPLSSMTIGNAWRHKVAELLREAFIESLRPDVVHISSFLEGYVDSAIMSIGQLDTRTPVSVSLYDLIPLTNPRQYLEPYPLFKQFYLNRVAQLRNANLILAISNFSRAEGIEHLELQAEDIISITPAVEPLFHYTPNHSDAELHRKNELSIFKPYVLYTGGADERKNLFRLIRAFAKLPDDVRNAHQLVFAGTLLKVEIDRLKREAKSAGLKDCDFILTGYISDEDLVALYSNCSLYVFPSWHEGFGLPALEAMACGAPVIGANASSLVEVIGYQEALFDPTSVSEISNKMASALQDSVFREELIKRGLENSKKFSWDASAQSAINAFERIASGQSMEPFSQEFQKQLITKISEVDKHYNATNSELARIAYHIDKNISEVSRFQQAVGDTATTGPIPVN